MKFVYLDEFGHIGPYFGRSEPKFNESPVFGLAGIILDESVVRRFATFVLKQKEFHFKADLEKSRAMAAKWEKKGTSFIRPKPIREYQNIRRLLLKVTRKSSEAGGGVFFYGREKIRNKEGLNPNGLYTTCLSHAIRNLDRHFSRLDEQFVIILDQHSARKELLECAAKTMFGTNPCRNLASPPFEVESYLNQNIQAADWIATLVGRLMAFKTCPSEFEDYSQISKIFSGEIEMRKIASGFDERPRRTKKVGVAINSPFSMLEQIKF